MKKNTDNNIDNNNQKKKKRDQQIARPNPALKRNTLVDVWSKPCGHDAAWLMWHGDGDDEGVLHTEGVKVTLEVVVGSGCAGHIVPPRFVPGFGVGPSTPSTAGEGFVTASGGRVGNGGGCCLGFRTETGHRHKPHFKCQGWRARRQLWEICATKAAEQHSQRIKP